MPDDVKRAVLEKPDPYNARHVSLDTVKYLSCYEDINGRFTMETAKKVFD